MKQQKVPILRKNPVDYDSLDMQSGGSQTLSYTKMVNELDEEEEKTNQNQQYFQSDNLSSQKNPTFKCKLEQKGSKKTDNGNNKIYKVLNQQDASSHAIHNAAEKRVNHKQISNNDSQKKLSQNGIQQSKFYQKNYLQMRNKLQSSLKPDSEFVQKISESKIEESEQENSALNHIDEESEIMHSHMTDSNSSHFIQADLDDDIDASKKTEYVININRTQQKKSSIKESREKEDENNFERLHSTTKHKSGKKTIVVPPQATDKKLQAEQGKSLYKLTSSHMNQNEQSIKKQNNAKSGNNAHIAKVQDSRQPNNQFINHIDSSFSEGSSVMLDPSNNSSIKKAVLDKVMNVGNMVVHLRNKSIQNTNQLNRKDQNNRNPISNTYFINKINDLKQQITSLQSEVNYLGQKNQTDPFKKKQNRQERSKSKGNGQEEQVQVSFKEHYKQSPSKNKRIVQKASSNTESQEQEEDEFNVMNIQNLSINVIPHPEASFESLVKMGVAAFQAFGVNYKKIKKIDIQKYQDCVQFYVPEKGLLINWEYSGKFYLGSCSNRRNKYFLQKQGEGTEVQPDEYIYKGEFSKNLKNGLGIINYSKGQKYQGEWKNDTFHGKGKLISSNSKYYGEFVRGKKQGFAKEMFNNGDFYQGEYDDGKFHGKGKYIWKNRTEYEGQFYNGFMEGIGQWKSANGDRYKGHYSQNQKHGEGVYEWKNKKKYKGKFEHGEPVLNKAFEMKSTIPVEKEISFDGRYSDDIDEPESRRMYNSAKKQSKGRFIIQSLEALSTQRHRKSPRKCSYHDDLE